MVEVEVTFKVTSTFQVKDEDAYHEKVQELANHELSQFGEVEILNESFVDEERDFDD